MPANRSGSISIVSVITKYVRNKIQAFPTVSLKQNILVTFTFFVGAPKIYDYDWRYYVPLKSESLPDHSVVLD